MGVLWAPPIYGRKGRTVLVRGKKGKRVRGTGISLYSIPCIEMRGDMVQEYGSGRSQLGIQSNTSEGGKQSGGTAAEYLHFGRLIGESAEESSKRLEKVSDTVKKDKRAELYLEKWNHEEEMSYQMFETLLDGDTEKTSTMKQLSFESIMSEEEAEIEATFESLVLETVPEVAAEDEQQRNVSGGVQVRDSWWGHVHACVVFTYYIFYCYYTTTSLWRDDTSLLSPEKRLASFFLPSAPMSVIRANSGSFISLIFTSLTSVSGIFSIVFGISARQCDNNEDESMAATRQNTYDPVGHLPDRARRPREIENSRYPA